jgi:hypothetical protein
MMPYSSPLVSVPEKFVTVLEPAVLEMVRLLGLPSEEEDEILHFLASLPPEKRVKEALRIYEPIPVDDEW